MTARARRSAVWLGAMLLGVGCGVEGGRLDGGGRVDRSGSTQDLGVGGDAGRADAAGPGCGLPAITLPKQETGEDCPPMKPACPAPAPTGSALQVVVSTCTFGSAATTCTPVLAPICPTDKLAYTFNTFTNPNPGAPKGCVGTVNVEAKKGLAGGVDLEWRAFELDKGCLQVGGELRGKATVEGSCCEKVADVVFPAGKFTFRVVFRTDWQK
ncbi:MAG: hypothetical protein IT371_00240 [Deltaproteobacteria bacterium]|nr:hypothetical protein [Deltaproteobacteria bacterium]